MADIAGKSVIARLSMDTGEGFRPVGYSTGPSALAQDGWLIQNKQEQGDALFRFDFIEMGGWLHCNISGAPGTTYEGAKVGASDEGYLGFYRIAKVDDMWRVDLKGNLAEPNAFEFVLRDYTGNQVGAVYLGGHVRYLIAAAGDTVRFRAVIVTEL